MYFIGYNYYHNEKYWTLEALVDRLELPIDPVDDVLTLLEQNSLIIETADDPPAYIPARDIETISLKELLNAVRVAEKEALLIEDRLVSIPEVDGVIGTLGNAFDETLGERTLKDIVRSPEI
jgi:membrane protein